MGYFHRGGILDRSTMTGHHKDPWKNEALIPSPLCAGVIFKLYAPVWLRSLLIGCCHLLRSVDRGLSWDRQPLRRHQKGKVPHLTRLNPVRILLVHLQLSLMVPHTAHFHMEAILMDQNQQPNPHATKISLKLMIHKIQSMKPTINLPQLGTVLKPIVGHKAILPVLPLIQITKILLEENINPHHLHLQV